MGCGGSKPEGSFPKIEKSTEPDVDEFFSSVEEPCNSVCDMSDALNEVSLDCVVTLVRCLTFPGFSGK